MYLLESYEEKEKNNAQSYKDFINSLDNDEIHNLENATDALEIKNKKTSNSKDARIKLIDQGGDCEHDWIKGRGDYNIKCAFCIYYPSQDNRFTCSICLKQACASCLKNTNQKWRQEIEIVAEDKILVSRVRNLENRINILETELEDLRSRIEFNNKIEGNGSGNIELNNQAIIDRNKDKALQLKDAIINFGNKYIVRLPFKEIVGIRIPVKVKLTPTITYKILALVDIGCTKNIIHDEYYARCLEIVHTIDQDKAEISTDMSGTKKLHNQLAYNIEVQINNTKYIMDKITIRDLSMINDDMILGLRFLKFSLQTTIIHEQGITFIPYQDNIPYITEVQTAISSNVRKSKLELQETDDNKTTDNFIDEELGESIEEFHVANSCIECISLQSLSPNWYRDIKSKKDTDKIVQRLEEIEIIGEILMKYWDKNGIVCKLNIINPDYIIKTSPIEATSKDIEEFKMNSRCILNNY
uniref:Retropepsins domain-containing protein n=1 Tax=Setaria italica TaxID=4555 RepID=K3ZC42_SETIT